MSTPFTIQIFYPDGDPDNMCEATKMGWAGKVFYISREFWTSGVRPYRDQLKKPGIYILTGDSDDENDDLQTIYIGQAENLCTRIDNHIIDPKKSFFRGVICVTGGKDFNKAHFMWMEADLINKAKKIDRCTLDNGNKPSKPQIGEADAVGIKQFLEETLQIFPVVQLKAFVAPKIIQPPLPLDVDPERAKKIPDPGDLPVKPISELRGRVVDAFQKKENVKLLKRSEATFYDQSKTLHVCCAISKNYPQSKCNSYWFAPGIKWFDFLASGSRGYLLFGMEEQSKAVILSFDEFNRLSEQLLTKIEEGEILWWFVTINEENGTFHIKLRGGDVFDLSPYLFDIE